MTGLQTGMLPATAVTWVIGQGPRMQDWGKTGRQHQRPLTGRTMCLPINRGMYIETPITAGRNVTAVAGKTPASVLAMRQQDHQREPFPTDRLQPGQISLRQDRPRLTSHRTPVTTGLRASTDKIIPGNGPRVETISTPGAVQVGGVAGRVGNLLPTGNSRVGNLLPTGPESDLTVDRG